MENQSSSTNTTTPSSSTHTQFLLLQQVQFFMANDNSLLQWEVVNVVDAVENEINDSVETELGSLSSPVSSPKVPPKEEIAHFHDDDGDSASKVEVDGDDAAEVEVDGDDAAEVEVNGDDDDDEHDADDDDEHDDDDDEHDDDGLDDELVPWEVSNKMGRERMRKLGKREFPKMINSKRSPHLFVSPGCVHGKHGLGLKHKY